jgi:hypothetical protein
MKFIVAIVFTVYGISASAQTFSAKDIINTLYCDNPVCYDTLFAKQGFIKMPFERGLLSLIETECFYKSASVNSGATDSLSRNYIEIDLFRSIGMGNRMVFTTYAPKAHKKLLKGFVKEGFIKYSTKLNNAGNNAITYQSKNPYLVMVSIEPTKTSTIKSYCIVLVYNDK